MKDYIYDIKDIKVTPSVYCVPCGEAHQGPGHDWK